MKGFKAYDIRGIYNQDFDLEDVFRIGHFLPQLFNTDRILVGHDHRTSSEEIREALIRGITSGGADVYDMGLASTPMVYFTSGKRGFEASVQITASHNPREYNGFKVSGKDVMPVGYANGLDRLEQMVHEAPLREDVTPGKVVPLDNKEEYLNFLKNTYYRSDVKKLNLAIDCSNGMAGYLIRDLLGDSPHYIYEELDGRFPHHDPNPLKEENQQPVKQEVLKHRCDAGILYDGDADRVVFVDEKGRFVSPDLIIALMGHYLLREPGGRVLQDIRSSRSVKEYLEDFGAELHTWKVGRAFACPKLREIDGIYGGEFAGHYYFRDFYYSDSAMVATLVVLNVLAEFKEKGIPFSRLIDRISNYFSSGEINYTIERKQEAIDAVVDYFRKKEEPREAFDFDGKRLDFPDWWINIRPSNTEPYLRVIIEARSEDLLQDKMDAVGQLLEQYQ